MYVYIYGVYLYILHILKTRILAKKVTLVLILSLENTFYLQEHVSNTSRILARSL